MRRRLCMLLACGLTAASAFAPGAPAKPAKGHTAHCSGKTKARSHKRAPRRCRPRRRPASRRLTAPGGASPVPAPTGSGGTPAQESREGSTPGSSGGEGGQGQVPPAVPHVQVSAVEFRYTLSRSSVPAGKVIFEFVDDGQDEHNLNVGSSDGELELSFATAQPKAVSDQAVVLKKGTYTLFCSLPEHEAKGMKATLTVA